MATTGVPPRTPSLTAILTPVIADLRFAERIQGIFAEHRPQVVFHAAAHKHVPLMETNPVEAITSHRAGHAILVAAAQAHRVERFVMISTDKAVNPTNVMGASKRVAELVLQAAQQSGRFFQVVRFGNVLGSRGSVIHTFREQIANGGPVLVTHPEMVRYFMTIPEAVQLVLQAAVVGKGAEVLMLDMGDPVRILDLARDLIELSGLQAGARC
ncbi:MAG: polysaccharide biosynthesis protein [Caldilineaceae bacterium]